MSSYQQGSDSHQITKRRRTVNACSECYRRKQKCDRCQPCSNCVARNVSAKCSLQMLSRPGNVPRNSNEPMNIVTQSRLAVQNDAAVSNPDPNQDSDDLGYSLTAGSNAFVDLKQLHGDANRSPDTTHQYPYQQFVPDPRAGAIILQLPPKPAVEALVEFYFADVNWHYFILERYYFDCLLSTWYGDSTDSAKHLTHGELTKELRYFPALLYQVLALAIQFLPHSAAAWNDMSDFDKSLSKRYSEIGVELMTILGKQNLALSAVQADFLRTWLLKNNGKGTEAWHSLGNAVRSAQEVSLHQQTATCQQDPDDLEKTLSVFWYNEYKRRLWMNLCIWDSLTGMILGRPRTINPDDCDTKLPIDCQIPREPSNTVPMTLECVEDENAPNSVAKNLFLYKLSELFHQVKASRADKLCLTQYSLIQRFHDEISTIMNGVPATLRSKKPDTSWDNRFNYLPQQREEVTTFANLFLMALHRPHITTHVESRRAALRAAIATLQSQQRSFVGMRTHHYRLFSLSFYTIDAAILLSIIAARFAPLKREVMFEIDSVLLQAIGRLAAMKAASSMARTGLKIVLDCYQKLKERSEDSPHAIASETISAEITPFTVLELGDSQRELRDQEPAAHSKAQPQTQSQSSLSGSHDSRYGLDPTMTDFDLSPTDFDETYWLEQMEQIPAQTGSITDVDDVWNSALFD